MMGIWQLHGVKIGNSSPNWVHCQYKIDATGSIASTKMLVNNVAMPDATSSISIAPDGTLTDFGTTTTNGFLSGDKSLGINTLFDGAGGYYLSIYQKDLSANGDNGMQVQFADNDTGWVSVYNSIYGYFLLYKTTNGGSSWDVINGVTNPVGGFYYFVDASNGWMFGASDTTPPGNYDILHTTKGGLSWTTQATNIGTPKALHFSDVNNGWLVGYNGLVMRTTDGGAHWTTLTNLGFASSVINKAVFAVNSNICYIGSSETNGGTGYLLKTTNGGGSWTTQLSPFKCYSMSFWNENNGWISGEYGQIARLSSNTNTSNPDGLPIKLFPNPSSDFLNVQGLEGSFKTMIYDISGRCIMNKQMENLIDIRSLSAGIYFLKLPSRVNYQIFRFVKN